VMVVRSYFSVEDLQLTAHLQESGAGMLAPSFDGGAVNDGGSLRKNGGKRPNKILHGAVVLCPGHGIDAGDRKRRDGTPWKS
jgi:hypothetical protein